MANYETAFKLKVVKSLLAGDGREMLLAQGWSVPEKKITTTRASSSARKGSAPLSIG